MAEEAMHITSEIKNCITQCWDCRTECQETLFTHCLEESGDHMEPNHVRIMMDCIQICQAAADSMTRMSPVHKAICEACASVCEDCAKSCEEIGGAHMKKCAETCLECARTCRKMQA